VRDVEKEVAWARDVNVPGEAPGQQALTSELPYRR